MGWIDGNTEFLKSDLLIMLTGYSVYFYAEYQEHGHKIRSSDDKFRDNSPGSQLTADLVLIDNHCFRSPSALRRMAVIKGTSKVPVRIVSIGHCRDSGIHYAAATS